MRVLIVEENASALRQLSRMVTNLRHDVVGRARDGASAIRLANEVRPNLIFFSVAISEMDPIAAIRVLIRMVPGVRIIALGGALEKARLAEAQGLGAVGFVMRPYQPADVRDVIRRYSQPSR